MCKALSHSVITQFYIRRKNEISFVTKWMRKKRTPPHRGTQLGMRKKGTNARHKKLTGIFVAVAIAIAIVIIWIHINSTALLVSDAIHNERQTNNNNEMFNNSNKKDQLRRKWRCNKIFQNSKELSDHRRRRRKQKSSHSQTKHCSRVVSVNSSNWTSIKIIASGSAVSHPIHAANGNKHIEKKIK